MTGDARSPIADGPFVGYGPTYQGGEDLDGYVARYQEVAGRRRGTLIPEGLDAVIARLRTADIPETASGWATLGREAGFSAIEELFRHPADLFRVFRFRP